MNRIDYKSLKLEDPEIIDRLYDVAIDPNRLEQLLHVWEDQIKSIPQFADDNQEIHTLSRATIDHMERVSVFLDRISERQYSETETAKCPFETELEEFHSLVACVVDGAQNIVASNTAAHSIFPTGHAIADAKLNISTKDLVVLASYIESLLENKKNQEHFLHFYSSTDDRVIIIQVRKVTRDNKQFAFLTSSELGWSKMTEEAVRTSFGLSQAELSIVKALVEGQTLKTISQNRARSIETVRTQIRTILSKTKTRSQMELIRIVLAMLKMRTPDQVDDTPTNITSKGLPNITPISINRPGNRRLDHIVLGDPEGKPCLYFPIGYGFIRWPANTETAAKKMGLKVIVPIRAGYGKSTPLHKNSDLTQEYCDDFTAILDHHNVRQCPILSLGSDSYFAFQLAHRHPHRFNAIISCGGCLPLWHREQYERMQKWHRFINANARYCPQALPYLVKFGFFLAERLGKNGFLDAVFGNSKGDVATYSQPEIAEALILGSETSLSKTHKSHRAFARDIEAYADGDWNKAVMSAKDVMPVHFLNGLEDQMVPPETLAEFQKKYPWIDFQVYPESGKLLFFQNWPDVFKLLKQYI